MVNVKCIFFLGPEKDARKYKEEKNIKISKTDKESGYYNRDNKEKGFMYLDIEQ